MNTHHVGDFVYIQSLKLKYTALSTLARPLLLLRAAHHIGGTMVTIKHIYYIATLSIATVVIAACGSSGSSGSSTSTSSSGVSDAVPSDVVIASPTASTSGSSNIAVSKGVHKALSGDTTGETYEDKKAAAEALQAGTGECGFTPSLDLPTPPVCYGPNIAYTNHPDAGGQQNQPNGSLPRNDTGFWNLTEGSEACAAAQMNYLINSVSTRVDMMLNMFNNMVCVGKKDGLALPIVGATTDFKSSLGSKSTMTGITVNTATIERLADDSDGNAVYKSTVSVTIGTRTGTAILKHIKTGTDTYKGKLSMTMSNETAMDSFNCQGAAAGSVNAGVVNYIKSSATSVVYEMNYAEFCGQTATPLDSSNNISRTNVFNSSTNPNGWGSNWNYGLFNLNPSNGTGTVAYAWQAGSADGRTRVLNATVTEASDTSASGTAYYGYGVDVNGSDTLGVIQGFICNWAGPNGAISSGTTPASRAHATLLASGKEFNIAQKQILSRAVGGTVYTTSASDSKITYAPDNSCNKAVPLNASFTFVSTGDGGGSMTNDVSGSTGVTNNLIDITEITSNFTLPTAPPDVGS